MSTHSYPLRLEENLWERLVKAAAADGVPVSSYIAEAVENRLSGGSRPSSGEVARMLLQAADVIAKLEDGYVLMPGKEVPESAWTAMLSDGGS